MGLRRNLTVGTVVAVFVLAVLASIGAADALAELGLKEPEAKGRVIEALNSGYVNYFPAGKMLKAASPAARETLVRGALAWARSYTESAEFRDAYAKLRESHKPVSRASRGGSNDPIAQQRAAIEKGIAEAKKNLASLPASLSPEMRKTMETTLKQVIETMTAQLAEMDKPQNQAMMKQMSEASAAIARARNPSLPPVRLRQRGWPTWRSSRSVSQRDQRVAPQAGQGRDVVSHQAPIRQDIRGRERLPVEARIGLDVRPHDTSFDFDSFEPASRPRVAKDAGAAYLGLAVTLERAGSNLVLPPDCERLSQQVVDRAAIHDEQDQTGLVPAGSEAELDARRIDEGGSRPCLPTLVAHTDDAADGIAAGQRAVGELWKDDHGFRAAENALRNRGIRPAREGEEHVDRPPARGRRRHGQSALSGCSGRAAPCATTVELSVRTARIASHIACL